MELTSKETTGRPSRKVRPVVRLSSTGLTVGTTLMTPDGGRPVEELKRGDRVLTKDFGYQEIKCVAFRDVKLSQSSAYSPIKLTAHSLGHDRPAKDVYVAPSQRIAIRHPLFQPIFGSREVVAQASNLLDLAGVHRTYGLSGITYVMLGFSQPQLVLTDSIVLEIGDHGTVTARPLLSHAEARLACGLITPKPAMITPMRQALH